MGLESAEGQPVPLAAQTVTYYLKIRKKGTQGVSVCVIDFLERRVNEALRKLDILKHVLPSNSPVSPWMIDHLLETT